MRAVLLRLQVFCIGVVAVLGLGSCQVVKKHMTHELAQEIKMVHPHSGYATVYPKNLQDAMNHVVKYLQDLLGNMPAGVYYTVRSPKTNTYTGVRMISNNDLPTSITNTRYNLDGDMWVAGFKDPLECIYQFIASAQKLDWLVQLGSTIDFTRFYIPGGYVLILEKNLAGYVYMGFSTPSMPYEEDRSAQLRPKRITYDDPVIHLDS